MCLRVVLSAKGGAELKRSRVYALRLGLDATSVRVLFPGTARA